MPAVLVLMKRTSYRTLVEERRDARVRSLIASGDPSVRRMRRSHESHQLAVQEITESLASLGVRAEFVVGPRTPVDTRRFDLVVTVGGDGTLLAASHQVGPDTPLLGVNSAPDSSVGFFCAVHRGAIHQALERALAGRLRRVTLTRMRVDLGGRCLHRRVLNEALFCHASPAATSRYILTILDGRGRHREEEQRSSGVWIGPAAGSTAAQRSAGGRILPLTSRKLQFVVREPYVRPGGRLRLAQGLIGEAGRFEIRSKMDRALIFIDGHHVVHEVAIGDMLTMRKSDEPLTVLGLERHGVLPGPASS